MGSTSAYRGLTIPTVAGDSGVWGTELNTSLAVLDSILGQTITFFSSTVGNTLTPSASQAQSIRLQYSSNGTGPFTLNLMSSNYAEGFYVVQNATAGNLTIASNGGTTVTLGTGTTAPITCDGVNVRAASVSSFGAAAFEGIATLAQIRALTGGVVIDGGVLSTANTPVNAGSLSGVFTPDYTSFINLNLTMVGAVTIANPAVDATPLIGSWRTILVAQDATGSRALSFGSQYHFEAGAAPAIATGANQVSRLSVFIRAANYFEVYLAGKNIA